MHRRESRASIDIATAERSPRQEFVKTVERQQMRKALKRKQQNALDATPTKNASPRLGTRGV